MQRPVELRWHGIRPSEPVATHVRDEAARLERYSSRITGCSVTLESPAATHHRHGGSQYRVRVELSVPGGRLVVGRDPPRTRVHSDLYGVVDAAFREVRRKLEDHVRRLDQRVKAHAPHAFGEVTRLLPKEGYGFLRTPGGRDVYFHARSVLNGAFARLRVGRIVRFVEEQGDEGPQASTVALTRRRRIPMVSERAPASRG